VTDRLQASNPKAAPQVAVEFPLDARIDAWSTSLGDLEAELQQGSPWMRGGAVQRVFLAHSNKKFAQLASYSGSPWGFKIHNVNDFCDLVDF
jgi:hypothetical protein